MSTKKSKNSTIISNVIIGLLLLGFGYYKFIYSAKVIDRQVESRVGEEVSATKSENTEVSANKKLTFGFFYLTEDDRGKIKLATEGLDKYFQKNGLIIDWKLLNFLSPTDVKLSKEMDFMIDNLGYALVYDQLNQSQEPIFRVSGCLIKPRFYVLKNSNYHKIDDLNGKKILIGQVRMVPNWMYDFVAKSKIENAELYSNPKQINIGKALTSHRFDAILVNSLDGREIRANTSHITEDELRESFRELPVSYSGIPCRAVFASKKLDKKVVDKFISIQSLAKNQDERAAKFLSNLERFTAEDVKRIISSYDWDKIIKLRESTKLFTTEMAE